MFGIFRLNPALSGLIFIAAVFIEIASIIIVGRTIGVLATLALLLLAMFVGFALLRLQSTNFMKTMQNNLAAGRMPVDAMADNAILMFAAILFIIPGFVGDIIALFLLIPQVRLWLRALLGRYFKSSNISEKPMKNDGNTIDLDAEDYHSVDPEASPWREDTHRQLPPHGPKKND